jgi:Fic family protein
MSIFYVNFDTFLLNSQLPYNQLPKLSEIALDITPLLQNACRNCWNSLYHLNGFIDAYGADALRNDMLLLQLADAKYSFELDNESISMSRLFEAWSSENAMKERLPGMVFRFISQYRAETGLGLNALKPLYFPAGRKNQDHFREKKELQVKSYHTNLTLYTAPSQVNVIRSLRTELDQMIRHALPYDPLIHMALCHLQLRALAPFNELTHHVARTYTQAWIRSRHMNFGFLPISRIISGNPENYQLMMREIANQNKYAGWCVYLIDIVSESAAFMLDNLKKIQALKKNTLEIVSKYTAYHLPAQDLLPLIFSRPYLKPKYLIDALHCHRQTAYVYLSHLVKAGILIEKSSGREKLYLHKQLFDVLSN